MSITQAVTTIFKGKDEQSQAFRRMSKSADRFGEKSSHAFGRASRAASGFGNITKGILSAGLISKAVSGVTTAVTAGAREFVGFDQAITQASAKFKGLNLATKEGQHTLEQLKKSARETGRDTKFSAAEAAQGLDFYATAGFTAAQAMSVIAPTARLAMATNTDLARTSDIASDSIGIFGKQSKDSAILAKNFIEMSDQMAYTMTSSNTNMEALFETIKGGGGIFTEAGQDMETFFAVANQLANRTIKGAKAGVASRNIMARLAKPTTEAQEALDMLGVTIKNNKGGFRDFADILEDFEKGAKKFTNVERLALYKVIAGEETMSAMSAIVSQGAESFREVRKGIKGASDQTQKMSDIMGQSLENRLLSMKSAAIDIGFQFFTAFEKQGGGAIDYFTKALRKVDLKPFTDGIKEILGHAGGVYDYFIKIGNKTGLFDSVKKSLENVEPVLRTMKDVYSTIFGFLERTGVIETAAKAFDVMFKAVGPLAKAFELSWQALKPFIEKAEKVLGPFYKLVSALLTGIGVQLDRLDAYLAEKLRPKPNVVASLKAAEKEYFKFEEEKKGILTGSREENFDMFMPDENRGQFSNDGREAPNQYQIESRQFTEHRARLDIAGAPEGSTLTNETSGPAPIDMWLLGTPRRQ